MMLLSKYVTCLSSHSFHSLVFWGHVNRVDVILRGTNNIKKIDEISFTDFERIHRFITRSIGKQPFPSVYQQLVANKLETPEITKLLNTHLTVTHQPLTAGSFMMGITLPLDFLLEREESLDEREESLDELQVNDINSDELVNQAVRAQRDLQHELTWEYVGLSNMSKAPYQEYEIRKEPLSNQSSYSIYWGMTCIDYSEKTDLIKKPTKR